MSDEFILSMELKCPFCQNHLWQDGHRYIQDVGWSYKNHCSSIACMINNDVPRYVCRVDTKGNLCYEEYALGKFYVKVNHPPGMSFIYKLEHSVLLGEIEIERPLWLNFTNFEATLDKLQTLVIFS